MKKNIVIAVIVVALLLLGWYWYKSQSAASEKKETNTGDDGGATTGSDGLPLYTEPLPAIVKPSPGFTNGTKPTAQDRIKKKLVFM